MVLSKIVDKLTSCLTVSKIERTCNKIQGLLAHLEADYPDVAKDISSILETVKSP